MQIEKTTLPDVLLVTPRRFGDDRGWFSETWNQAAFAEAGCETGFVQDNHSFSASAETVRGLHYQAPPHAQDKLVRCTRGEILDVAVDARVGSPSYGHWISVRLSAQNGQQLFVPKGFLHGFATLVPDCEVQYKVTDIYAPDCDGSVRWDSLGIDWQIGDEATLSAKDVAAPRFEDWQSPFIWEGAQ